MSAETVYSNGDLFFSELKSKIDSATVSIDLETYIFEKDTLGNAILVLLKKACERGVNVRILLDGVGASNWSRDDLMLVHHKNLAIQFFHPLPWQRRDFRFYQLLAFKRLFLGLRKLNHRNHRKTCVVDRHIAFVGSMNISAKHLIGQTQESGWRDTSLKIEGPRASSIQSQFNETWTYAKSGLKSTNFRYRFGKRTKQKSLQIQSIEGATQRIWITTPYFLPSPRLLRAFAKAANRGVELIFLFPSSSDFYPSLVVNRSFYKRLLRMGAKIYEYQPSFLHAKVSIIDNSAVVGSSNMNYRSLFRDLEADVSIEEPRNIQILTKQFQTDLAVSNLVTLKAGGHHRLFYKLLEYVFLLFREFL